MCARPSDLLRGASRCVLVDVCGEDALMAKPVEGGMEAADATKQVDEPHKSLCTSTVIERAWRSGLGVKVKRRRTLVLS